MLWHHELCLCPWRQWLHLVGCFQHLSEKQSFTKGAFWWRKEAGQYDWSFTLQNKTSQKISSMVLICNEPVSHNFLTSKQCVSVCKNTFANVCILFVHVHLCRPVFGVFTLHSLHYGSWLPVGVWSGFKHPGVDRSGNWPQLRSTLSPAKLILR